MGAKIIETTRKALTMILTSIQARPPQMMHHDAVKLAAKMTRDARIPFCAEVVDDRIVFTGRNKSHSLDIGSSTEARILAHWEFYITR
jgi:hypothetical protein